MYFVDISYRPVPLFQCFTLSSLPFLVLFFYLCPYSISFIFLFPFINFLCPLLPSPINPLFYPLFMLVPLLSVFAHLHPFSPTTLYSLPFLSLPQVPHYSHTRMATPSLVPASSHPSFRSSLPPAQLSRASPRLPLPSSPSSRPPQHSPQPTHNWLVS